MLAYLKSGLFRERFTTVTLWLMIIASASIWRNLHSTPVSITIENAANLANHPGFCPVVTMH